MNERQINKGNLAEIQPVETYVEMPFVECHL